MARHSKWADPNGPHTRVYLTILNSPAWRVLGPSSVKLFMDLRATLTGTNNGNLNAALSELKHRGWSSSATLATALYELRALGFIAETREGGLKIGTRACSLYRFTDLEVYEQPKVGVLACKETHDYKQFKTVRDAELALAEGVARLREEGRAKQIPKKKSPVQNLKRIAFDSEPIARFIASETEQGAPVSLQ